MVVAGANALGLKTKISSDAIQPIKTADYQLPAPRPANSRLDTTKIKDVFMLTLPSWQDQVSKVLQMLIDSNGVGETNG